MFDALFHDTWSRGVAGESPAMRWDACSLRLSAMQHLGRHEKVRAVRSHAAWQYEDAITPAVQLRWRGASVPRNPRYQDRHRSAEVSREGGRLCGSGAGAGVDFGSTSG